MSHRLEASLNSVLREDSTEDDRKQAIDSLGRLDVRVSQGSYVPYREMPLTNGRGEHALRAVRLGPLNEVDIERPALQLLLHRLGLLGDVDVDASQIPVRG